jgi:transcription initiation factor TFIIIB Brf1 subunit/transcription initiation factor TFIIB
VKEDPERYESWGEYLGGDDEDGTFELVRATYVCVRCGAVVSQYHTDEHDQFHAQIDALTAERK